MKGAAILSDDAAENVDNLEKAAKWFVPYCTQDGYLGAGIYDGGGLGGHPKSDLIRTDTTL